MCKMTNEEKRAEFIKACEVNDIKYSISCTDFYGAAGIVIPEKPVPMLIEGVNTEVIAFVPAEYSFITKRNAHMWLEAPKHEPVKIPWDAEDFDREPQTFIKNKATGQRILVESYFPEGVLFVGSSKCIGFDSIADNFIMLNGQEFYKEESK